MTDSANLRATAARQPWGPFGSRGHSAPSVLVWSRTHSSSVVVCAGGPMCPSTGGARGKVRWERRAGRRRPGEVGVERWAGRGGREVVGEERWGGRGGRGGGERVGGGGGESKRGVGQEREARTGLFIAVGKAQDWASREGTGLQGMSRFMTFCGCRTQGGGSKVTVRQAAAHIPADPAARYLSRHEECVPGKSFSHQACAQIILSAVPKCLKKLTHGFQNTLKGASQSKRIKK